MKITNLLGILTAFGLVVGIAGCGGIPKEQQKNYALVESRVSEYGSDMDSVPSSRQVNTSYISYVDGKAILPAWPSIDLAPGKYRIQLGIGCGNTATCRPGTPYDLNLEAGKRYVLKPSGIVFVSDRFANRSQEVRYTE